jgi:hypothetical protein
MTGLAVKQAEIDTLVGLDIDFFTATREAQDGQAEPATLANLTAFRAPFALGLSGQVR